MVWTLAGRRRDRGNEQGPTGMSGLRGAISSHVTPSAVRGLNAEIPRCARNDGPRALGMAASKAGNWLLLTDYCIILMG